MNPTYSSSSINNYPLRANLILSISLLTLLPYYFAANARHISSVSNSYATLKDKNSFQTTKTIAK